MDVVSIIGNAKNAGKTTVLNHLLKMYDNNTIAISSIGMDGEPLDNVSFLPKPQINLKPGFLVATAEKFLETATIGGKTLKRTDMSTPFGNIVVAKATKPGKILVAGPSSVSDMEKIVRIFKEFGSHKNFIDGAFSRQSTANLADGTILVSGANRSPILDVVVDDTKKIIDRLSIPKSDSILKSKNDWQKTEIFDREGNSIGTCESSAIMDFQSVLGMVAPGVKYLYVPGAVTADFVRRFMKTPNSSGVRLVVFSPTNLIADELVDVFPKPMENRIQAVRPVNLFALCYNPFSPAGYVFEEKEFREKLQTITDLPIYNVLANGSDNYEQT